MIESLVVFLREGIEVALVLGIVLSLLKRTGQSKLSKFVYSGLSIALLLSILVGIGLWIIGMKAENEMIDGIIYLFAALLISTMVIWMWRSGKRLKESVEGRISELLNERKRIFQVGLGLFIFTVLIVLREGVETVFFMVALMASFKGNPILVFVGSTMGTLLALGFGFLLIRGSIQIPLKGFFRVTGIILLAISLRFVALGFHELSETGILPTADWWLRIIGFLSRDNSSIVILILLILIPSLYLFFHSWKKIADIPSLEINAVERRKAIARMKSARFWSLTLLIFSIVVSTFLAFPLIASPKGYDPTPVEIQAYNGRIEIDSSEIEKFKKFVYRNKDSNIRFFILKNGSSVHVALDDCEICPPLGYYLSKDNLMCRNCDAPISIETVGQRGGCNPIPISYKESGSKIVIPTKNLVQ